MFATIKAEIKTQVFGTETSPNSKEYKVNKNLNGGASLSLFGDKRHSSVKKYIYFLISPFWYRI